MFVGKKLLASLIVAAVSGSLCLPAYAASVDSAQKSQVVTKNIVLPASQQVLEDMERVANWQLPRVDSLNYIKFKRSESLVERRWVQGAFYTGLTKIAERSSNPVYAQWIGNKGAQWDWALGPVPYFGDDQLIGDTYIWYYKNHKQDPEILKPTIEAFDKVLAEDYQVSLEFTPEVDENIVHLCQKRWCWADALFMAPPTWFALSEVTGDEKYADYAHREMQATIDYLFDEKYDLLYRDSRFKSVKGEFGEQLFWARGSGWVFAGLARAMDSIPEGHRERAVYEKLFVKMAKKLKSLQKADGSWAMSLLAKERSPLPETSGTGFFTYGLMWGINNGLLSEKEFIDPTMRGWSLLNSAVHPDGKLGWVQAIGAAPGEVSRDDSQLYGVGAYLLAGSEVYDFAVAKEKASGSYVASSVPVMAYARHVPERRDDFAWENDKVAFRVYGPAAPREGHSSGVDAWLKKVDYSIIDKWYAGHQKGISYHVDRGEGYDPYHTGISRGVGGSAIWVDGKPYAAPKWHHYEVHQRGEAVTDFTLHYRWDTPLGLVEEQKRITLALGDHLYHTASKFSLDGKPAKLPIAIGLATHDEKARVYHNDATARISTWEMIDDKGLGTAAILPQSKVEKIEHIPSDVKDESHIWIFTSTDKDGFLEYKAGFGWEGAGLFDKPAKWNSYIDSLSRVQQW